MFYKHDVKKNDLITSLPLGTGTVSLFTCFAAKENESNKQFTLQTLSKRFIIFIIQKLKMILMWGVVEYEIVRTR